MLKQLYIKNFTLIDTLDIQLHPGFSVITGETGAGKSIILGAIGLLLGQRADSKSIKQGADKCVIEAHFDLSHYGMEPFFAENDMEFDPDNTIIRRELTAAGKSRAFVNDTPVPLTVLKELGERLVDVHSQHQNLLLQKQDFQLSVVDILANDTAQLDTYHQLYGELQARQKALQELKETIESNRQREDFLQFQFDELSAARLVDGEQEELEQKSATMTHAEDIKSALFTADNALSGEATGIVTMLRTAASTLRNVERVFPAAAELTARLDSAHIELKDIAQEVAASLSDIDFDPAELDAINARLDKIYDLQKKYHTDSIAGLLDIQANLEQKLAEIENGSDTLQELQQACDKLMAACGQQAAVLTGLRTKAARQIEKDMKQRLEALGMPNVRFAIDISPTELTRSGQDKVQFLFSANSSTSLQPVAQVASGGEIARVMLSLKAMISSAVKLPTIIFDEIDTGVSGKIAEKMAEIMQEMGRLERQVISITHLPQIAALGTTHYKVQKTETADGTTSTMTELSQEERVSEIAQMLSGSNVSEAAIANARQLLKI